MTPASLEGQTLGKYRILERLGRGGMAQVYKAYHPGLDRFVAVKVLRADLVEEQEFLARFRREARAVAALRHPNIVQIHDFDVQDDLYYMVMELLEGDTLKAHLNAHRARGEKLPLGTAVRILQDVLAGLAYAHSEGIVHRDLKPANILLSRRGQAVLTDFGIAQIIGGTQYTVSGALMGTLNYMAPEQGLDSRCDARSDIYSLGIVLFEMLTGSLPYDADTPLAILMKHVNDPLPRPTSLDPGIPEAFEGVVFKALAKKPDDRYQNAGEMAEALSEAARQAKVIVPRKIELPQTGLQPPAEQRAVAVFSGADREQIRDDTFAKGETSVTIGQKPADSRAVSRAALGGAGTFIGVNLLLLWASGIFGWGVFGRGWPLELLTGGILLIALMTAIRSPWLLIPGGILLGNGLLFGYCALTGWWSHWTYFWPLEPLLVGASIYAPFWFAKQGERGRQMVRKLGVGLLALSAVSGLAMIGMAIILTVFA